MQFLTALRGLAVLILGGTLVGFVPEIESPFSGTVPHDDSPAASSTADSCPLRLDLDRDDSSEPLSSPAANRLAAADEATPSKTTKPKEQVKATVFLSTDKLPAGGKCEFVVVLQVQEGWHINANPPNPENMIPTKVTVQSKHKSKQFTTTYPEGREMTVEELPDPVSVYEGEVRIRGEIQAAADAAGKTEELEFQVKYQACNEKTCYPPKTLKLSGQIPIVKPGTAVKQVNQKYFPKK